MCHCPGHVLQTPNDIPVFILVPAYLLLLCVLPLVPFAQERWTKAREQSSFLPALYPGEFWSPKSLRERPQAQLRLPKLLLACIHAQVSA